MLNAIAEDGEDIVFSDGSRTPKSRFSAESMANIAAQISKMRAGSNPADHLVDPDWGKGFLGDAMVKPEMPAAPAAKGGVIDVAVPTSLAPAPLLGQQQPAAAPAPVMTQPQQQPMAQPAAGGIPMAEHSQTTTTHTQQDPAAVQRLHGAQDALAASVMEGAQVGVKKAAEESVIRQQAAADLAKQDADNANKLLLDENAIEAAQVERRKMLNDLSATQKDPDRTWKRKGMGAKIAAAIFIAFDQFGSALAGRPGGTAYGMIRKEIEDDLDAQDKEIQIKRDKINAQDNLIAQIERQGLRGLQARSVARQHMLENVAMRIEATAAKYGGLQANANAAQTVAQLRAAAAAEEEHARRRQTVVVKSRAPAITPEQMQKLNEDERERFVPSVGGVARTKQDAQKLIEYDAQHGDIVGQLTDLKKLVDKHGNESFGEMSNQMAQDYTRVVVSMKELLKLGVLSGPDLKLLEAQVANPTDFLALGTRTSKRLGTLIQSLNKSRERTFRRYGMIK